MKVFYSPYSITPQNPLNALSKGEARHGALLKIDWGNSRIGYADVHPWTELGDQDLEIGLNNFRSGKINPLFEQAIWLASRDADLRMQKQNAFQGAGKLKNNFTVPDSTNVSAEQLQTIKNSGFQTLKIKMGRDFASETDFVVRAVAKGFFVRLDFNGLGSYNIFEKVISGFSANVLSFIEYVEDPFSYDLNLWKKAQKLVPIALDNQMHKVDWNQLQASDEKPFSVLVIKPAKTDVDLAISRCQSYNLKATVTSYMDHSVGALHALHVANELKKQYGTMMLDPGCLTHNLYQMNSYSAVIETQGPFLLRVPGTGIGFDKQLGETEWLPLKNA